MDRELKKGKRLPVHVRWLVEADMPEVLNIEELCFGEYAWDEERFMRYRRSVDHQCYVAVYCNRVVGVMVIQFLRRKFHIVSIAVHPCERRQQVGSQLLGYLVEKLSPSRRQHITLDVLETETQAQLFFKGFGFLATNIMPLEGSRHGLFAYRMEFCLEGALSEFQLQPKNRISAYVDDG